MISLVINKIYNKLYDFIVGNLTSSLFNTFIKSVENNSKVLDFGCGNGICYINDSTIKIIKNNNINIVGIDINKNYILKCSERIQNSKLENNVSIKLQNLLEYNIINESEKFDYIIFMESAPLMSNKMIITFIEHMKNNLLKQGGKIVSINNIVNDDNNIILKFY